jgi:hypothetical protein
MVFFYCESFKITKTVLQVPSLILGSHIGILCTYLLIILPSQVQKTNVGACFRFLEATVRKSHGWNDNKRNSSFVCSLIPLETHLNYAPPPRPEQKYSTTEG